MPWTSKWSTGIASGASTVAMGSRREVDGRLAGGFQTFLGLLLDVRGSMLEVPGRFLASLGARWELLGSILDVLDSILHALGAPGGDFGGVLDSILDLPGTDFGGFGLASSCLAVKFQAPGNNVTIE